MLFISREACAHILSSCICTSAPFAPSYPQNTRLSTASVPPPLLHPPIPTDTRPSTAPVPPPSFSRICTSSPFVHSYPPTHLSSTASLNLCPSYQPLPPHLSSSHNYALDPCMPSYTHTLVTCGGITPTPTHLSSSRICGKVTFQPRAQMASARRLDGASSASFFAASALAFSFSSSSFCAASCKQRRQVGSVSPWAEHNTPHPLPAPSLPHPYAPLPADIVGDEALQLIGWAC